jgi:hypothetical protein
MRGRKRLAVRVGDREVMHEFWLANLPGLMHHRPGPADPMGCQDGHGRSNHHRRRLRRSSPDGEGTGALAASGVVARFCPGSFGLCPVRAFPVALCLFLRLGMRTAG